MFPSIWVGQLRKGCIWLYSFKKDSFQNWFYLGLVLEVKMQKKDKW